MMRHYLLCLAWAGLLVSALAADAPPTVLLFEQAMCAGISGFRAHWDLPMPVSETGERLLKDAVLKDRGQTAVWDGIKPGPLAFDAVHRSLLVRFPEAASRIAEALATGQKVAKVELILPFLDEELWPQGGPDFPRADGYRYRTNWDTDKLWRKTRPNWHAVLYALRQPWQADATIGPTYNANIAGASYWTRFGASDTEHDRFPQAFGPVEVSSYNPEVPLDLTALLTDVAYGATLADRLRVLADYGFIINKLETYDARYFQGAYEWAISTGPRAILIKSPKLRVTLAPAAAPVPALPAVTPVDVPALAAQLHNHPRGTPTALIPSPEAVAALDQQFMVQPKWMPDWQYQRVRELMALETGTVQPFYYRLLPEYVVKDVQNRAAQRLKKEKITLDVDYLVYLAFLDWVHARPPRYWEGHLTAADNITQWYNYRAALPEPVQDSIRRCWTAWLMPDRASAMSDKQRKDFGDLSGELIHPMADDPRVGVDATGKVAEWNQGDTYYRLTGDWRGNKSYYRSGFTRMMSTANFNSSASSGALLNGQIIGSEQAMADGRAGMLQFPFWLWTYNAGVGQEYIDHYYWAIATAGNKLFADFCERPADRLTGWSILTKTVEDLAGAYHPNLRKLIGPSTRTYTEHVLGQQDGLYHILHVLSPRGVLSDMATGKLPALSANEQKPISAWGHDYPATTVALQSLSGPWADAWMSELVDEKPLPWWSLAEKKVVSEGDWVSTYMGVNYGLSSICRTSQRMQVLGQWRRETAPPTSMRGIGTLDLRLGYNQTQIGNDGSGIISEQGKYLAYQDRSRLILLARPNTGFFNGLLTPKQDKAGKPLPIKEIRSVQMTAALFNYELPAPTWKLFVDDQAVTTLPATAKAGQLITIQDGISYLAIRPLPASDLGRDLEISLEPGVPQTQAYHESTRIQPALLINAYLYHQERPLSLDDLPKLNAATAGFIVEMGDAAEYGDFAKFQAQVRAAQVQFQAEAAACTASYTHGTHKLVATWPTPPPPAVGDEPPPAAPVATPPSFTVNGQDPFPRPEQGLWRDTPLTQMGLGELSKLGATISRPKPGQVLLLQTFPKQRIFVATNPLPRYQAYRFQEPGGVRIIADGLLSMGRWAVRDSKTLDLRYAAFDDQDAPAPAARATLLFISGTATKPSVVLNQSEATAQLKAWTFNGQAGWLLPLAGALPPDDQINARLTTAQW